MSNIGQFFFNISLFLIEFCKLYTDTINQFAAGISQTGIVKLTFDLYFFLYPGSYMLHQKLKRYRYPLEIISISVWSYHRFNDRYRDVSERLLYRGIAVTYETIRQWCIKFGPHFKNVAQSDNHAALPENKA